MLIRDFLNNMQFDEDEPTFVPVDPLVQVSYHVGDDGNPKRTVSTTRIEVPTFEWDIKDENDLIFRVMNEASKAHLIRAKNFQEIDHGFWAKRRFNLKAFAIHPNVKGKFYVPPRTVVFCTEEVEPHRIVCVGDKAGTLIFQGETSTGYVVMDKDLLSVLVANP